MKRRILKTVFLVLILVLAAVPVYMVWAVGSSREREISLLEQYGIEFWDSPTAVAKKLGVQMARRDRSAVDSYSFYSYQVALYGKDSDICFWFTDNRRLTDAVIHIHCVDAEAARALMQTLVDELETAYGTDQRYQRKDADASQDTIGVSISLNDGPFGRGFDVRVDGSDVDIYCYYQSE